MKDAKDLRAADLALPPKLGRPVSGNALSNSQKQKAYRLRKRVQGSVSVVLTIDELCLISSALIALENCAKGKDWRIEATVNRPGAAAEFAALADRFKPLLDQSFEKFREGSDAQGKKS